MNGGPIGYEHKRPDASILTYSGHSQNGKIAGSRRSRRPRNQWAHFHSLTNDCSHHSCHSTQFHDCNEENFGCVRDQLTKTVLALAEEPKCIWRSMFSRALSKPSSRYLHCAVRALELCRKTQETLLLVEPTEKPEDNHEDQEDEDYQQNAPGTCNNTTPTGSDKHDEDGMGHHSGSSSTQMRTICAVTFPGGATVQDMINAWESFTSISTVLLVAAKEQGIHPGTWLADSGASIILANDESYFVEFVPFEYSIGTADKGNSLKIMGGGTVELMLNGEDGAVNTLAITDAAFAPAAHCNLLSLTTMARKAGFHGIWNKNEITITTDQGYHIGRGIENGGLYHLDLAPYKTSENKYDNMVVPVIDLEEVAWKWHRRLGHLSWQNMRLLLGMSEGCDLTDKQVKMMLYKICPICAVTKAVNRIPREPARRRAENAGELVHVDSWGPYPIRGYDNSRYALFMIDDKERFTWVDTYAEKSELPLVFKAIHKKIERSENMTIRNYRMDGEF